MCKNQVTIEPLTTKSANLRWEEDSQLDGVFDFESREEKVQSCASLAHAYLTRSQTVDSVNCVLLLLWGRKGME